MHRVAILTYDKVALFELGCAVELFGLPRPEFERWYECEVVSFNRGPFSCTAGLRLISKFVKNLNGFDLLVIPSWPVDAHRPGCPWSRSDGVICSLTPRDLERIP